MAPWGQQSELAKMSRGNYEADWNGQTDGQDHILNKADTLTKNQTLGKKKFPE